MTRSTLRAPGGAGPRGACGAKTAREVTGLSRAVKPHRARGEWIGGAWAKDAESWSARKKRRTRTTLRARFLGLHEEENPPAGVRVHQAGREAARGRAQAEG